MSDVALLVIDVQRGLFKKATPVYQADQLLENIQNLITSAHNANDPVFYVQHANESSLVEGSDNQKVIDEWHHKLMEIGVGLIRTQEIDFAQKAKH